jgi:RimJ/RimL family protein N-acetyltransferase
MADDRQILETERLILRKLTPDDLEALFRLYRDPIDRLICLPIPENTASIRVAEKMGMHLERELVLDGSPALLYSIAKS